METRAGLLQVQIDGQGLLAFLDDNVDSTGAGLAVLLGDLRTHGLHDFGGTILVEEARWILLRCRFGWQVGNHSHAVRPDGDAIGSIEFHFVLSTAGECSGRDMAFLGHESDRRALGQRGISQLDDSTDLSDRAIVIPSAPTTGTEEQQRQA